jgi:hypothetical protein
VSGGQELRGQPEKPEKIRQQAATLAFELNRHEKEAQGTLQSPEKLHPICHSDNVEVRLPMCCQEIVAVLLPLLPHTYGARQWPAVRTAGDGHGHAGDKTIRRLLHTGRAEAHNRPRL